MAKKLILNIAEEMEAQIITIQKDHGFFTKAEAARACLNEGIRKLNPAYIQARKSTRSPEERARELEEAKDARDQMKFDNLINEKQNICDILGGDIENIEGNPHCRYKIHTEMAGKQVKSIDMLEPLADMNMNAVERQYRDIFGETGPEVKVKLLNYIHG